jgi:hypothetical protein
MTNMYALVAEVDRPSNPAVTEVFFHGELLAIILKSSFREPGIHFLTSGQLSQQLAYMHYQPGKIIPAHAHNPVPREVIFTQEVLFIRRGKVRVDFYDDTRAYLHSHVLETGDVILLAKGGHGFEILEESEIIEVKQGPYAGDSDKTRFPGITAADARVRH